MFFSLRRLKSRSLIMFILLSVGLLIGQPGVEAGNVVESDSDFVQFQVGNGFSRQVPVGEPSATCADEGAKLDLVPSDGSLHPVVLSAGQEIIPILKEINGTEQIVQIRLGQNDYQLYFWKPENGGIAAVEFSEGIPAPAFPIPKIYLGWRINADNNRVVLENPLIDTTVWLIRENDIFCMEILMPEEITDDFTPIF